MRLREAAGLHACRGGRAWSDEAVSQAALVLDAAWSAGPLDLAPETTEVHLEVIRGAIRVRPPDPGQEHVVHQQVTGVPGQMVEQFEFDGRQVDDLAVDSHLATVE